MKFANTFEKPPDDLLFSNKSQMKRKTKLAICSLRNSVGNVKRGSNTLWKKIINNKWN